MRAILTSLLIVLAIVANTGVASPAQAGARSVPQVQAVIFSEAIVASVAENQPAAAKRSFCSKPSYSSEPPKTIRVFRIHKKGSSVPARIDTVPLRNYAAYVMAAGAWPASKPGDSLNSGAAVIIQNAWQQINHHNPQFSWRGHCFDIMPGSAPRWCSGCDHGQYYKGPVKVHSNIWRAIDKVWGTKLYKKGRFIKPHWSGDGGRCGQSVTGFRLPEDAVTKCARKGWSWLRILCYYFAPVRILLPGASPNKPKLHRCKV